MERCLVIGNHRRARMNVLAGVAALLTMAMPSMARSQQSPHAEDALAAAKAFAPVQAFLRDHCVKCHSAAKKAGGIRLDDLDADVGNDIERWLLVHDQVRDGTMPPQEEPRPKAERVKDVVGWVSARTLTRAAKMPNHGNLVPHDLLFNRPPPAVIPPAGRIWRLNPEAYLASLKASRLGDIMQPFSMITERGFKDYASLYTLDEPTTEILVRNARLIVERQCDHEVKDGKVVGKGGDSVREFVAMMDPETQPTRKQLEAALLVQFQFAYGRKPGDEETERFYKLYDSCLKTGSHRGAVKTMLQAVLLRAEALFRSELAEGKSDAQGKAMLAPQELVVALSLALGTQPRSPEFLAAAQKGELATPEQVAAAVRRQLDNPKADTSRILGFFREYFEYGKAPDVFKNPQPDLHHRPDILVHDTDRLINHILAEDKDVFRLLLTTDRSFANYNTKENKQTRKQEPSPFLQPEVPTAKNPKPRRSPEFVYGFETWPSTQPTKIPAEKLRLGILMQPSWLVAFSTNFHNDPVRRGRWIRERLLGGAVLDLPIGVEAMIPDHEHRTLRQRFEVTRDAQCWKCHRKMDELGLPFEQFDHFGRHRTAESIVDLEATEKNVDSKGKSRGNLYRDASLDTTGRITNSGDPKLDGDVKSPVELIRKLADSTRVRQVFVRHVFRYYLGRNETLADAKTLQDADRAYVESGGSFKTLVITLLSSESFLYRTTTTANLPTGESK